MCYKMCYDLIFYSVTLNRHLAYHFKKPKIGQRPKSRSFKSSPF